MPRAPIAPSLTRATALNSAAASSEPHTAAPWTQQLLRRIFEHFWLKLVGISAFMALFFVAYFHVLRNPVWPVMVMPLTALDTWLPFQPWAFWAYVSLWVYVGVPAGAARDLREALRYGAWAALLSVLGLICFYAWPTVVPLAARAAEPSGHAGFAVLQGLDAAGNACPSLHVAAALFSAAWTHRLLRGLLAPSWALAVNATWALLIVYSTLAIKQHVLLDVLGGTLLAALVAVLSLRLFTPGLRRPAR